MSHPPPIEASSSCAISKGMRIPEAVAALRSLDALPDARRRYLCVLAARAATDTERSRIVLEARRESRRVRENLTAALRAEFTARTQSATRAASRPVEPAERPTGSRYADADGMRYPEPRPVTISWTQPTKTGHPKARAEGVGKNREYVEEPPRKNRPEHGLTGYNKRKCRCEVCVQAKKDSRLRRGLRRPNGGEAQHGTISRYSNNKCRCDECRSAAATYQREWRARQRPN